MTARRPRRPRRRRFDLGKAMFVLPNLFTVSSIFCGFYAIILAAGTPGPAQFTRATLSVFFGVFFDMADGRVARLTRTQSEFGVQMDSLADLITFGLAPAVIVQRWALAPVGTAGILAAFAYVAAGAIRLARFNVLAAQGGPSAGRFFVGLPIPLAAGVLMSMVMAHQRVVAEPDTRATHVWMLLLGLSVLMVSNVRYRTFKDVGVSRRSVAGVLVALSAFAAMAVAVEPAFALLAFFSAYVALGLAEGALGLGRRRRRDGRLDPREPPREGPPAESLGVASEGGRPAPRPEDGAPPT